MSSKMCRGSNKETRGTAYVVYEDIYDAKTAVEHLSGFNVANRYLIVLYYNHNKHSKKVCPVCSSCLSEAFAALAQLSLLHKVIICAVVAHPC